MAVLFDSFSYRIKEVESGICYDRWHFGKYPELTFNIGHVDETNKNGSFILTAYLDGEEEVAKQIICDVNTDIDIEQSVPLNNAKILILEWRGDDVLYTTYGLTNIKLK